MTSDDQLICRRCGFKNVPGDQFCGSCGAFLEWEGESVAADAPPPAAPRDTDVPGVAAAPAAQPVVRAAQPVEPAASPSDAGLIRCPACGIANTASRTFCQSCGTKLAEVHKFAEPSAEQIAAAVAASGSASVTPTTPVRPTRSEPAASSSGGVGKWILIVAVFGVLIGAGVVGASVLLRGEGPASEATTGPSAPGTGAAPSAATGSGAPASGDPSGLGSAPPAKSVALALTGATASSVVGDLDRFQPGKAIDGDPATAWQEGNAVEKGQWIEVAFAPSQVTAVVLSNGYNASRALYRGNRRLKDVRVSVDGGDAIKVRLKDTGEPQRIKLSVTPGATTLRITIVSTYPGVKTSVSGTPFDDAALGEIVVIGVPGS